MPVSKIAADYKTDIMPRLYVFFTGIPETGNNNHGKMLHPRQIPIVTVTNSFRSRQDMSGLYGFTKKIKRFFSGFKDFYFFGYAR